MKTMKTMKTMKSVIFIFNLLIIFTIGVFIYSYFIQVIEAKSAVKESIKIKPLVSNLKVDSTNSSVEFMAIGNPGMLTIEGKGKGITGDLTISSRNVEGTFECDLNTLETGIDLRDKHMKEKYLEIEKAAFAKAEFKLTKLTLPDKESFTTKKIPFEGKLKLHGVEKLIKGEANIDKDKKNKTLQSTASFNINVKDFNITIPTFAGINVGENVKIQTKIIFIAK
ncbi:MAG: YceI family protein [Oligoflexia bacterium]|nr:YceI family protein [Oligoflexia bacterium]